MSGRNDLMVVLFFINKKYFYIITIPSVAAYLSSLTYMKTHQNWLKAEIICSKVDTNINYFTVPLTLTSEITFCTFYACSSTSNKKKTQYHLIVVTMWVPKIENILPLLNCIIQVQKCCKWQVIWMSILKLDVSTEKISIWSPTDFIVFSFYKETNSMASKWFLTLRDRKPRNDFKEIIFGFHWRK